MSTSRATLSQDHQHILLAGDGGMQALFDDRQLAPAGGGVEGSGAESRAEQGGTRELIRLVAEIDGLRRRLLTQPAIEQAKGVLIGFYGVDADVAFAVLVRWSQHSNTKLHVLAVGLVAAASQPSEQPHAGLRRFIENLPTPGSVPASVESARCGGPSRSGPRSPAARCTPN